MTEELLTTNKKAALPLWARIVLSIIAFLFITGIFQVITAFIANIPIGNEDAIKNMSGTDNLMMQLSGLIALSLLIYIFRKLIDRKSILSLGFSIKNRAKDILAGFLVASGLIGGGTLILYAFGYVNFTNFQFNFQSTIISFLIFIIVALNEEIYIRGYILNNLMTSMNRYYALILSSIIFTLMHSLNFNISVIALLNIFLAGILLGISYIYTKNLWFPISLHLFWNFIQGPILGYKVSGQTTESVITINQVGNDFIHGGEFGFEGSIVCTILIVLAIIGIMYYYRKNINGQPISIPTS